MQKNSFLSPEKCFALVFSKHVSTSQLGFLLSANNGAIVELSDPGGPRGRSGGHPIPTPRRWKRRKINGCHFHFQNGDLERLGVPAIKTISGSPDFCIFSFSKVFFSYRANPNLFFFIFVFFKLQLTDNVI